MKLKVFFVLAFVFGFSKYNHAQNVPPAITVEGNQEFCGSAPMNIVTSVSITDPDAGDDTLDNVFIQISEGYTINQDLLVLNGTYPNITSSWSAQEGKLTLEGPANFTEFIDAISNVTFQTTQTNFTQDKSFSINLGGANYLPSTGHYYLYVSSDGITWTASRNAAENLEYFGLQGYLATLTSEEESIFAGEQSLGTGWIGASDVGAENTWRWETGPEAGTVFWMGTANGEPVNGEYSFWNDGEPNNFGNEDYAHITDPSIGNIGSWNDLPNAGDPSGPGNPYYPRGFFVEFGGMPGDPEVNLSASSVIITPKMTFDDAIVICNEGEASVTVNSNTDTVLWYETPSSTTVLNDGFTYNEFITTTTTYWVLPLFDGCVGGPRTPITVTVPDSTEANNITITQCDDATQDGITSFNINNSFELITGGVIDNRAINYFEDANLNNEINGSDYTNMSNPQVIYALVTNTLDGCTNIAEITLDIVLSSNGNSALIETCDDLVEDGFVFFDLSEADVQVLSGAPINASVSYYATYDDASLEVNSLPNSYFNTIANEQVIYARINSGDACYSINEVVLRVKPLPNINTFEEFYYCLNNFPDTITLSGGIIEDIPNNYYYNWSTGETTMTIEVNEIGTYTVLVTEPDGCVNERIINVIASNVATVDNVIVEDVSSNNSITVLVSGEGDYEYSITSADGPYQTLNTFENIVPGIYTVYVRDTKNDCGVSTEDVSVVGFTKFFTPNNDGYNDTWQLKGISEQFQPNSKVFIFDRFGKLLYTLNSPLDAWDGTFKGKPLPASDYWFSATLEDGRSFKNHFTLKR
ncbi:T9SS type B sorting domain-containing protein [uncultured Psychroserpens sp.]|uniref:T9SS type B sorting domain-containing protein n=1 Tax=uncultured Psychroserpens sp. TaxID=255436 RepID=UPI002626CD2D|nr:T9SS type B sorting domain-containing protein [uncultured Psychroserpens sp.]